MCHDQVAYRKVAAISKPIIFKAYGSSAQTALSSSASTGACRHYDHKCATDGEEKETQDLG